LGAAAGVEVHFAEAITTVRHDLRQVQPTIVFAPPAVWERLAADIDRRLRGATRLKRWVWRVARAVALRNAAAAAATGDQPRASVAQAVGHVLVYRPLRDRIGMRHVRYAACAGAVAPEVLRLFHGLGVPLAAHDGDLTGMAS
jgi:long-chain acyl-CoA synthetase